MLVAMPFVFYFFKQNYAAADDDDDAECQGDPAWNSLVETSATGVGKSLLVRRPRPLLSAGTQLPVGPAADRRRPPTAAGGCRAPGGRATVAKTTARWARVSDGVAAIESTEPHVSTRYVNDRTQGNIISLIIVTSSFPTALTTQFVCRVVCYYFNLKRSEFKVTASQSMCSMQYVLCYDS